MNVMLYFNVYYLDVSFCAVFNPINYTILEYDSFSRDEILIVLLPCG